MDNNTVLVLSADLADPDLKLLAQLPPETSIAVGNSVEAFERLAADATVIFSWSASGPVAARRVRDVPQGALGAFALGGPGYGAVPRAGGEPGAA